VQKLYIDRYEKMVMYSKCIRVWKWMFMACFVVWCYWDRLRKIVIGRLGGTAAKISYVFLTPPRPVLC